MPGRARVPCNNSGSRGLPTQGYSLTDNRIYAKMLYVESLKIKENILDSPIYNPGSDRVLQLGISACNL